MAASRTICAEMSGLLEGFHRSNFRGNLAIKPKVGIIVFGHQPSKPIARVPAVTYLLYGLGRKEVSLLDAVILDLLSEWAFPHEVGFVLVGMPALAASRG